MCSSEILPVGTLNIWYLVNKLWIPNTVQLGDYVLTVQLGDYVLIKILTSTQIHLVSQT